MFAVEVPARTKIVRYTIFTHKHRPVYFVGSGWGACYAPFPIELIKEPQLD